MRIRAQKMRQMRWLVRCKALQIRKSTVFSSSEDAYCATRCLALREVKTRAKRDFFLTFPRKIRVRKTKAR